ncbi:hypothetical protein [Streptomyces sp. BRA346]|uniref:hypothetical protein n=1 Tax=Streptomyces sp. BRA346 TaxID=2878199 RepID=UPI00406390A1
MTDQTGRGHARQSRTTAAPAVHLDGHLVRGGALRIDPDASSLRIDLPGEATAQDDLLRELIGDTIDRGHYHRQAPMHVHGSGQRMQLPVNVAAWALACAWRGLDLPYLLYGPVVVTGPYVGRVFRGLDERLVYEAEDVARRVGELRNEWATRAPVDESAARRELLAYARRAVRSSEPS